MDALLQRAYDHYPDQFAIIEKAFYYSQEYHKGQLRDSGDEYFVHPYEVANILMDMGIDAEAVAAGLLHDTVEDVEEVTYELIEQNFGEPIAKLVEGVTKLEELRYAGLSRERRQAENIRKMVVAMSKDIRVILIKIADRLHNMRTLDPCTPEKQRSVSRETLDIYAPLSARLGIFNVKWALEDLAFKYLYPDEYHILAGKVTQQRREREKYIAVLMEQIGALMEENGIKAEIEGRPKHLYSIFLKMQDIPFEEIYDLLAIRIIVSTVNECYLALGIIHANWRPLQGRIKDYISNPKVNMYQSLHTTLLSENRIPFEVQIRTQEMHHTAEYGIAAHWKYKEGRMINSDLDDKLSWLRSILEVQEEMNDAEEFVDALKIDLYSDEVMVFTPKWKIIFLPKGATPIDFAYRIHSDIGNHCYGAKINGKMVPLTYQLQTGDICEILTQSNRGPSLDWRDQVKTATARSKILAWFRREHKDENIVKGRTMLELAAKRAGYPVDMLLRQEWLLIVCEKRRLKIIEDLYAAIGCNGLGVGQVVPRLIEEYRRAHKQAIIQTQPEVHDKEKLREAQQQQEQANQLPKRMDITVVGHKDMLVRLAHCCSPVYGDEIIGYITRGRGVSVHRSDCKNLQDLQIEPDRFIDVAWDKTQKEEYPADIQLTSIDRPNILSDIMNLIGSYKKNFIAINARTTSDGITIIGFTINTDGAAQLDTIMTHLRTIDNVIDVNRVSA